jgi:uncharacterized membrane protein YhaH (DUF805 family)
MAYLAVLLNPRGRLPRDLYWYYAIPLFGLTILLTVKINAWEGEVPPMALLIGLITVGWMKYCVLSRRIRDCNKPGAVALPIFVLASATLVARFFPEQMLGPDDSLDDKAFEALYWMSWIAKKMLCVFVGYGMLMEGDAGKNLYGRPLGTLTPEQAAARRNTRVAELRAERGLSGGSSAADAVSVTTGGVPIARVKRVVTTTTASVSEPAAKAARPAPRAAGGTFGRR